MKLLLWLWRLIALTFSVSVVETATEVDLTKSKDDFNGRIAKDDPWESFSKRPVERSYSYLFHYFL
jgi:hypothetical protein